MRQRHPAAGGHPGRAPRHPAVPHGQGHPPVAQPAGAGDLLPAPGGQTGRRHGAGPGKSPGPPPDAGENPGPDR